MQTVKTFSIFADRILYESRRKHREENQSEERHAGKKTAQGIQKNDGRGKDALQGHRECISIMDRIVLQIHVQEAAG